MRVEEGFQVPFGALRVFRQWAWAATVGAPEFRMALTTQLSILQPKAHVLDVQGVPGISRDDAVAAAYVES